MHNALAAAQAAAEAAEAALAASAQQGEVAVPDDDLDLITATPEELEQVLRELHAEAQREVAAVRDNSMTFTELLQSALEGFDVGSPVFDPQYIPQAPVQQPIGKLATDADTAFDEDALVASLLGE